MNLGIQQMSGEAYYADPCETPSLSYSVAKVLLEQSPMHAWLAHPKLNPNYQPDESARFDLGTAAHDLLLEGGTAKICVIDPQEHRSKPTKADPEGKIPTGWTNGAMREARDTARGNGLVPVLPWDNAKLRHMLEVAQEFIEHSELKGIFQRGKPEQTVIWQDDGVTCRSRLDWLTDDRSLILDYKTTVSAEPEAFIRQISRMNYDLQAAFYTSGVAEYGYKKYPNFTFFAQEIEAPYACSLISLSNAYLEIAMAKYRRALALWRECIEANKWPAYPSQICYAEPPAWQLNEYLESMEQE